MIRVLFDLDVLLDVIEERSPHVNASAKALASVESGKATGFVAALSLPTVFYLLEKHQGRETAYEGLRLILRLLEVVPLDHDRITQAMAFGWADFEDALQAASALQVGADVLVTRSTEDYEKAPVSIEVPEQFLARLTALQEDGRDETAPSS